MFKYFDLSLNSTFANGPHSTVRFGSSGSLWHRFYLSFDAATPRDDLNNYCVTFLASSDCFSLLNFIGDPGFLIGTGVFPAILYFSGNFSPFVVKIFGMNSELSVISPAFFLLPYLSLENTTMVWVIDTRKASTLASASPIKTSSYFPGSFSQSKPAIFIFKPAFDESMSQYLSFHWQDLPLFSARPDFQVDAPTSLTVIWT